MPSEGGEPSPPIPLLTFDEPSEKFDLNEEAVECLQAIKGKIAVVATCGPYRSGKSFLLSKLATGDAANEKSGFAVGHKVASCTRGIWILRKPMKIKMAQGENGEAEELSVIFMDVEGFGATDKTAHYDSTIFSVAVLLCSCLVYNTNGTIDESSIGNLAFITHLTERIRVHSTPDANDEGLGKHFPDFCWVLRDFLLELTGLCFTFGKPCCECADTPLVVMQTQWVTKLRQMSTLRERWSRRADMMPRHSRATALAPS
jgi:hypothetical protein